MSILTLQECSRGKLNMFSFSDSGGLASSEHSPECSKIEALIPPAPTLLQLIVLSWVPLEELPTAQESLSYLGTVYIQWLVTDMERPSCLASQGHSAPKHPMDWVCVTASHFSSSHYCLLLPSQLHTNWCWRHLPMYLLSADLHLSCSVPGGTQL